MPSPFATPNSQTPTRILTQPQPADASSQKIKSTETTVHNEVTRVVPGHVALPHDIPQEPRFAPKTQQTTLNRAAARKNLGLPMLQSRTATAPVENAPPKMPAIPRAPLQPQNRRDVALPMAHRDAAQERTTLLDLDDAGAIVVKPTPRPRTPEAARYAPEHLPNPHDRTATAAREVADPTRVLAGTGQQMLPAKGWQHTMAVAIDAAITLSLCFAAISLVVGTSSHSYPKSHATLFENFAVWLARSGSQPVRAWFISLMFLSGYGTWGARHGATVGRALAGLVLVDRDGQVVGWSAALWHGLGCGLNALCLGAGTLWAIVDRCHRSWACLLSRTQVVPSHQVVPR